MSFDIVLIKPGSFAIDKSIFTKDITNEQISQLVTNKLEFINTDLEGMMNIVVDTIKLQADKIGDTTLCYEDSKSIFQLCHYKNSNNGGIDDDTTLNELASLLTLGNESVYGDAILICSAIKEDYTCQPASIGMKEVVSLIYNKIVHIGVLINNNGDVREFKFVKDPLENYDETEVANYQWMELPFLNFNLILFVQVVPSDKQINKKVTKLAGRFSVQGDCILVSKSAENEFLNLDGRLFDKLLKLSTGPLAARNLNENEKKDNEKVNNLPLVYNRYHILEERYNKYKDLCQCCAKKLETELTCQGCYRVKYHDSVCQKDDWYIHKQECLYGKNPLNSYLIKK